MPFISVTTSVLLEGEVREKAREAVYEAITLVPGKTREGTMVQIRDGADITKGNTGEPTMFIEARMFTRAPFAAKKEFAQAVQEKLAAIAGIAPARIYLNILDLNEWGSNGDYRSF